MPRPMCVRSTALKVFQDELMTELLRRFPAEQIAAALQGAYDASRKRFPKKRHDRNKARIFFRHLATRLPDVPDLLGVAVGLIDPEQIKLPDVGVEDAVPKHCMSVECRAPAGCYCGCMSCGAAQSAEPMPEWKAKLTDVGVILDGPSEDEEVLKVLDAMAEGGNDTEPPDALSRSLEELGMSFRTAHNLQSVEIRTIGQIARRSERELLDIKNFGRRQLQETKALLAKLGVSLRQPLSVLAPPDVTKQAEEDAKVHEVLDGLGHPKAEHGPDCAYLNGMCTCGAIKNTIKEVLDAIVDLGGPAAPVKGFVEGPPPKAKVLKPISLHTKVPVSKPKLPPEAEEQRQIVKDAYTDMIHVPKFEDYEAVFVAWPYVWVTMLDGKRVLALGYLSGRDPKNHDALVRRNCAYSYRDTVDKPFKGLVSVVGLLKKVVRGTRLHVKVIPYKPGAKVRFWTNVRGEGDREEYNRYRLLSVEGLVILQNRWEYDNAAPLHQPLQQGPVDAPL